MAIRFKGDIMAALKEKGYSSTRLRNEHIFGEKTMQDFRNHAIIPNKTLNRLCGLLDCQIGDIIEFVPENDSEAHGESVNAFINRAVSETIERDNIAPTASCEPSEGSEQP